MLVQVFPVMIIELILCSCKASTFTYLLGLNILYSLFETLYTAYYAFGLLAYVFALVTYLPFGLSFVRVAWHDSEARRYLFYK